MNRRMPTANLAFRSATILRSAAEVGSYGRPQACGSSNAASSSPRPTRRSCNRLGLGFEELRTLRPGVIMISFSGYGATGPKKHYIAYGPVQVPMTGLASVSGYPGRGPNEISISYGDPNAALHAALAVLAALRHRQRTGVASSSRVCHGGSRRRSRHRADGRRDERHSAGGSGKSRSRRGAAFRCAGVDEWVAIACWSDAQWRALARAIGRDDLERNPRLASAAGRKREEASSRGSHQDLDRDTHARAGRRGAPIEACRATSAQQLRGC